MAFKTVFIGNGLGRAIDNSHFDLSNAINTVWNSPKFTNVLTPLVKRNICDCLPMLKGQPPTLPQREDELEALHKVVMSCATINYSHRTPQNILNANGVSFPDSVNFLIRNVAYHFHQAPTLGPGFTTFFDKFKTFIQDNNIHVTTTNYDDILYTSLINDGIMGADFYKTQLVDGFLGSSLTFHEDNLERKFKNNFGWYLHLHGSPLFYSDRRTKEVKKLPKQLAAKNILSPAANMSFEHLVLHHFSQKPEIISGSNLLSVYWDFFNSALDESDTTIVFGYGGFDKHINTEIHRWVIKRKRLDSNFKLIVVCRNLQETAWAEDIKNSVYGSAQPNNFEYKVLADLLTFDWKV